MGEFRRQQSKVWWSNDEDTSRVLGWGAAVDLSGQVQEDAAKSAEIVAISTLNKSQKEEEEEEAASRTLPWGNSELSGDRGSSSSPSQGSHKSQDSGFSDSELHHNALSESPQDSPDLSKRLDYPAYNTFQGPDPGKAEDRAPRPLDPQTNHNKNVSALKKLKTSPAKSFSYQVVEFKEDCCNQRASPKFLETDLDVEQVPRGDPEPSEHSKVSPRQCKRRNLIKTHVSRTKDDHHEKINQIQNQLELSFKLPKKINLPQNFKISNLITQFQAKPQDDSSKERRDVSARSAGSETTEAESDSSLDHTVIEKLGRPRVEEGFKVPKTSELLGSNNFLNLTDLEGPPLSSSTPLKAPRQDSPVPKAARATEKVIASTSTFATIRKLKGLAETKVKGTRSVLSSLHRYGSFTKKPRPRLDTESSTRLWLAEVETQYEAEVMTTLQSKSLATDLTRQVTNMAATTSETVRRLHQRTKTISSEFTKLCQHIKCKKYKQIGPLVQSLIGHIKEFMTDYVEEDKTNQRSGCERQRKTEEEKKEEMITDFRAEEPETKAVEAGEGKGVRERVEEACDQLRVLTTQRFHDHEALDAQVSRLGAAFTEVVDGLLVGHIQALVHVLEEPRTELALRTALSAMTTLGLEGTHLSQLVARCGGVRALLAICLEARATAVRVAALRGLATVCCIAETIRQLEQAGGVDILADLLGDPTRCEAELSEAAAVLAQITAPWVEDNHTVKGLGQFLGTLVVSLTRIVKEYRSSETLLLSAAALANLTFMEPRTVWPLLENNTAGILLTAVRRQGPKVSVFIQEQAATVIANMAAVPECRRHLAEHRAVVALLCFLQIRHSPLQRAPEITAAERVQQKSAIALSRLCSDVTVAKQVVELQGVTRLVRLCKEERERNHSDGVLVACLAALRKIVANCGTGAIEQLDAMELVEPRLLDSFLLYSTKQESYV